MDAARRVVVSTGVSAAGGGGGGGQSLKALSSETMVRTAGVVGCCSLTPA